VVENRARIVGTAAGVPFLAVPPETAPRPGTPVVVAWHLMDPPRTEAAFAAALPLRGLNAWRVYLGLPLCGARLPAGGAEELTRLGYEDAVLNLQGPIVSGAAEEFPAALAAVRAQLGLGRGPVALVGGSAGAAVAQLVLAETGPAADIETRAAVLISPMTQLRPVVDAVGRRFGVDYRWREESLRVAQRLDFVSRSAELAAAGQPAIRLVVGAEDDAEGFLGPARRLRDALAGQYDDAARVDLAVVPGMGHALADEPGIEPAPQTAPAAAVDRLAVEWLRSHLTATTNDGRPPSDGRPSCPDRPTGRLR
jgi:hypothetical protein